MRKYFTLKNMITGSMIAAIYTALTLVFAPISYGGIQLRVSEAMCILPYFTPAAVPGLFIGCVISNLFSSNIVIYDVIFGSLATLVSAYISYKIKVKWLVPLPAVLINAAVVGIMLSILTNIPLYLQIIYVGAGQIAACYVLGMPLLFAVEKIKNHIK